MKITVKEKEVIITEQSEVNAGERCVNECEFLLPESFADLSVTAVFNNIPVPLVNGKCYIPSFKKGSCVLGVYAYKKEDGELKLVYSPKPTVFCVGNGSFTQETCQEEIPHISRYEEYCRMLLEYWEDFISKNTLSEYSSGATAQQFYSASVINAMYAEIQGNIDGISTLVGGAD